MNRVSRQFLTPFLAGWESRPRWPLILVALVLLVAVGVVDYLSGFEILFSAFYMVEVGLAAWFVGRGFGLVMALLSVAFWIGGDWAAGARYSNLMVPIWNAFILLTLYLTVVWLVTRLHALHRDLESTVRQRTEALEREMTERQRLEEEILQISEREQRRIGHDLHDSLCQHLTATALAGQVLAERLGAKTAPEAADAGKVVAMVEEGIEMARGLARGLYPVEMEAEGLMRAFQELADTISRAAKVQCVFGCDRPVLIHDDALASHLYRIVQEAVRNAIRHGKPQRIDINLTERDGHIQLTIEDDGIGLPESGAPPAGLGLRIMAHRARVIGGHLTVEPAPAGGTMVTCSFGQPHPRGVQSP